MARSRESHSTSLLVLILVLTLGVPPAAAAATLYTPSEDVAFDGTAQGVDAPGTWTFAPEPSSDTQSALSLLTLGLVARTLRWRDIGPAAAWQAPAKA
jgi:hypothetical protein